MGNIYEKLVASFAKRGKKIEKFAEKYQSILDFPSIEEKSKEAALKAFLKPHSKIEGELNTRLENTHQRRNLYRELALLHYLFDIPIEDFDLSKDDPFYMRVKENPKAQRTKFVSLSGFYHSSKHMRKSARRKYQRAALELVQNLSGDCYICDMLERFEEVGPANPKSEYLDVHKDIFTGIQKRLFGQKGELEEPRFNYARFLVLPKEMCDIKGTRAFEKRIDLTREIIQYCPENLFNHILFCLQKHRKYEKADQLDATKNILPNYGFYAVGYPFRHCSYAVLNDGHHIYAEHYKRDNWGELLPEYLLIEKENESLGNIGSIYNEEIKYQLNEGRLPKLTLRGIKQALDISLTEKNPKTDQQKNLKRNKARFEVFLADEISDELRQEIIDGSSI